MDIRNWYQDAVKEVFTDIYVNHHILVRSQLQWIERKELEQLSIILNDVMKSDSLSTLDRDMLKGNHDYWNERLDIRLHGYRLVKGLIPILYVIMNSPDSELIIPDRATYREIIKKV